MGGGIKKDTKEKKKERREHKQIKRGLWEVENLGGFRKIYSAGDLGVYDKFIIATDNLWGEYLGTKPKKLKHVFRVTNSKSDSLLIVQHSNIDEFKLSKGPPLLPQFFKQNLNLNNSYLVQSSNA